jgi:hypothetical protein
MRGSQAQRQRTRANPLDLGTFDQTSLRYLKGSLGPKSQVVGYRDSSQESHGGYGGGAYNHWFKINLSCDAWIITVKGAPRPKYINVSVYDLNEAPIQGRGIFDADSVTEVVNNEVYYPYVGHVMGAQSDLYNFFDPRRLDKGDDRYFPLSPGSYLLCVSTTRNEPLDYTVGLVIEVQQTEFELLLETGGLDHFIYENELSLNNTIIIGPAFTVNYSLPTNFNGYTSTLATINSSVTVTVPSNSSWFISSGALTNAQDLILLDATENYTGEEEHQHSLSDWQAAWTREYQQDDRFPDIFVSLTTIP